MEEMSNIFEELTKYIEQKKPADEEEKQRLIEEFLNEHNELVYQSMIDGGNDAGFFDELDDGFDELDEFERYMEAANESEDPDEALRFVKKALKIKPGDIDALCMQAEISTESPNDLIKKYKKILDKAEKQLEEYGYSTKKDAGHFWLIHETRPYMRLLGKMADLYKDCGKFTPCIEICKEALRLCPNDNLGIRYTYMCILAYLERVDEAEALLKEFKNDISTQFLFPLSMLYYKIGDEKKALSYLKKLNKYNEDTMNFFSAFMQQDAESLGLDAHDIAYGYRTNTMEEYAYMVANYHFLPLSAVAYFEWAYNKLIKM